MKKLILLTLLTALVTMPALATNTLSRSPMQDVVYFAKVASMRHQAEIGHADAQFALGNQYYRGDNPYMIPQDYDQARRWYFRAARQGHSSASYNLAVMHIQGNGVKRDLIEALAWLNIAASRGHGLSKELVPELESLLKPEHIRAARELQSELVPRVVLERVKRS